MTDRADGNELAAKSITECVLRTLKQGGDNLAIYQAITAALRSASAASPEREPVAWQWRQHLGGNIGWNDWRCCTEEFAKALVRNRRYDCETRPLYAHPRSPALNGERGKHTSIPWHVNHDRPDDKISQLSISNGDARIIANVVTRDTTHGWEGGSANAALIVEAVNNYDSLRAQLSTAQAFIRQVAECEQSDNVNIKRARELIAALTK